MPYMVIKGGHIIDPGQGIDKIADLLVEGDIVRAIDKQIVPPVNASVIDAAGMIVSPGFVDLHCHLREPGYEDKETIATGTRAAAVGGFSTICAMPNTNPPMDSWAAVDYVLRKANVEGIVRVLPIGCVTKGSNGLELSEMGELSRAGVVGFSDDGNPVSDPNIMRQALSYSSMQGLPIINHCEVPELFTGGSMNEGWISNRLGIKGIPNSAEEIMVTRDIALAELTGGRFHVAHMSTSGALEQVRQAKERGLNVTCEVTPHHLTLSDETILGYQHSGTPFAPLTKNAYDTYAKVNPPLRSRSDVDSMVAGLRDGVIDFIATDHAPHSQVDKLCTFHEAAFGISAFETALGSLMSLVHKGKITLPLLIEKLTASPARFLGSHGLNFGTLKDGMQADITIFDPDAEWIVEGRTFASKGKNTPLEGATLKGRVMMTMVGGKVIYNLTE